MRTLTAISWAAAIALGIVVGYGTIEVRAAQDKPVAPNQAARPQRTEAEARALAEKHRQERAQQRKQTGKPVELISDYVKAQMQPVPASLGVDPFYTKYVDAQGIPVISSDKVPDDALLVARDIINSMLAKRPDLRAAMIARKWRTGVIAEVEMTMDIPEYSRMKRPGAPRDEPVSRRIATTTPTVRAASAATRRPAPRRTCSAIPDTRYYGEHIFVHEFAHAIMGGGIRDVDPKMHAEIRRGLQGGDGRRQVRAHRRAQALRHHQRRTSTGPRACSGGSSRTSASASPATSRVETPEEFAAYDPTLNELISRVFDTPPHPDGCVPRQAHPPCDLPLDRRGQAVIRELSAASCPL